MKFTLEVNEEQMQVLCDALEMYSRMGMGQLDVAVGEWIQNKFHGLYYDKLVREGVPDVTRGWHVGDLINRVKQSVFGHPVGGSWSIYNSKVPRDSKEAWDIYRVLRKAMSTANKKDNSFLLANPDSPLVEVSRDPSE